MFNKIDEIPLAIRQFYIEDTENNTVNVKFGETKSLGDVYLALETHAKVPDKHWIINSFVEMYWEGVQKEFHDKYLEWYLYDLALTEELSNFVPEKNSEGEIIETLEDATNRINGLRVPEPTLKPKEEAINTIELQGLSLEDYIAKSTRKFLVDNIVIEVDNMLFDGNEDSQRRLSSAIEAMTSEDINTILWKLHDNSIVEVTIDQLKRAHNKAILKQSQLWV
jgi:hypothetical protein